MDVTTEKPSEFRFSPIAVIESCYREKFGIPRQPGLVPAARAVLRFNNHPDLKLALRELAQFSHCWIVFVFHGVLEEGFKPTVRPPRLDGNHRRGVLSTRSPHRPNPIGISVVKIEKLDLETRGGPTLEVSGGDLLDGTPVLDVKPYLAYCDSIPDATTGWMQPDVRRLEVRWNPNAQCPPELRDLVEQTLRLDPRPSRQARSDVNSAEYALQLAGYDVHWRAMDGICEVLRLVPKDSARSAES